MADLYPSSYANNRQHQSYHRHADPVPSYSQMGYPSQPVPGSGHSGSSNDSSEDVQEPTTAKALDSQPAPKSETKPQATFLTKLYAYVLVCFEVLGKIDATVLSGFSNAPKIIT